MSVTALPDEARALLEQRLGDEGYSRVRRMDAGLLAGQYIGIRRFAFTVGLCVGLDWDCYHYRYCYPLEQSAWAIRAAATWDGEGHPPGPWVKCKGTDREFGNPEMSNEIRSDV